MENMNCSVRAEDIELGARIRLRRRGLGLSQGKLSEKIGVTFQQLQKYETGANRVSFSRLCQIADKLDCTVMDLIEGITPACGKSRAPILSEQVELLNTPRAMDMLRAFSKLKNCTTRAAALALVRALAK